MNATLAESASSAPAGTGCGDFSDPVDSPVRMLSLHSRPVDVDQPHVGGYDFTQRQPDHVSGNQRW